MALIVKPHTFTAGTSKTGEAAQVNANYDAIYGEFNGNIEDANVKAGAAIAQSKINNLVTDLAALGIGWKLIQTQTASNSAAISFTSGLTSTYRHYMVALTSVYPATDDVSLVMRFSQSASFLSGAGNYGWAYILNKDDASTPSGQASASATFMQLANNVSNIATRSLTGHVRIYNPAGAATFKKAQFSNTHIDPLVSLLNISGSAVLKLNTDPIDGVQFLFSSGNITSGVFSLYGLIN